MASGLGNVSAADVATTINQPGMGQLNLLGTFYTPENYNAKLASGLTHEQIVAQDPNWASFGQFPFSTTNNQVSVVPQVPPTVEDVTDQVEEQATVQYDTPQGDVRETEEIRETDSARTIPTYTDQELIDFGMKQGFVTEEGRILEYEDWIKPSGEKSKGLFGGILKPTAIRVAEQFVKKPNYDAILRQFSKRGMVRGTPDGTRIMFSPQFEKNFSLAQQLNKTLSPASINKYSVIGPDSELRFITSGGGSYNTNTGKYETYENGVKKVHAYGSMQDAIDLVNEAMRTNDWSRVPKKKLDMWKEKEVFTSHNVLTKDEKYGTKKELETIQEVINTRGGKEEKKTEVREVVTQTKSEKKGKGPSRQQQRMKKSSQGKSKPSGYEAVREYGR
jgi:hypothetical protein